jgi:hypothetical protein
MTETCQTKKIQLFYFFVFQNFRTFVIKGSLIYLKW